MARAAVVAAATSAAQTGVLRLFNDLMGGQASWLLPAALLALVGGLAWRWRAPRTDRTRAALMLWGSWLVVSGLVFSLSGGVIHTYYTVALAPAIAALAAIGAAVAWRRREQFGARALLALGVVATAAWSIVLLGRTPSWEPWLAPLVAVAAGVAALGLLMPARVTRRLTAATAVVALVACLAGPVAYSAQTIGTAHTGSTPSAGTASSTGGDPGGGFARAGSGSAGSGSAGSGSAGSGSAGAGPGSETTSSALVAALKSGASGYRWAAATSGSQSAATLELATGGVPVMAIGGFNNQGGNLSLAQFEAYVKAGDIHYYIASAGGMGGFAGQAGGAGLPSRFAAGAGGRGGSPGAPAGFPGRAGSPGGTGGPSGTRGTAGGPGGPGGGGGTTSAITSWVKAHYRAETIGGQTVYDLTQPLGS